MQIRVLSNSDQKRNLKWKFSSKRKFQKNRKLFLHAIQSIAHMLGPKTEYGHFWGEGKMLMLFTKKNPSIYLRVLGVPLWCTCTEHLMHEISDLMQGSTFSYVTNSAVYICIQYFITILWEFLSETITIWWKYTALKPCMRKKDWSLTWDHWFRAWDAQCMCTINVRLDRLIFSVIRWELKNKTLSIICVWTFLIYFKMNSNIVIFARGWIKKWLKLSE